MVPAIDESITMPPLSEVNWRLQMTRADALTIRPFEHYFELVWDPRRLYALRVERGVTISQFGRNKWTSEVKSFSPIFVRRLPIGDSLMGLIPNE